MKIARMIRAAAALPVDVVRVYRQLRRHDPESLRLAAAQWLLRGVRLEDAKFGQNTITISPSGVGDLLRWSGTQNAIALGDLGMNVATGKPQAFVSGATRDLLAGRVVATGSTLVPALTTVVLTTQVQAANETYAVFSFMTNNVAGASWAPDRLALTGFASISIYFRRTAVAGQFEVVGQNGNAAGDRTMEWALVAIVP